MRKTILLVGIFGLLLLTTTKTNAQCTCATEYVHITAQKEFALASIVFVGKVVSVTKSDRDEKNSYIETVSFKVTKAWKHDLPADLTITNVIQGCVNGFEDNEEWLVYAYRNADGSVRTRCCCSRTKLL